MSKIWSRIISEPDPKIARKLFDAQWIPIITPPNTNLNTDTNPKDNFNA